MGEKPERDWHDSGAAPGEQAGNLVEVRGTSDRDRTLVHRGSGTDEGLVQGSRSSNHDHHVIELWLHGRSPHTCRAYRADVTAFLRFAASSLPEVSLGDLQSWSDELLVVDGLAAATVARKLSSVRSLLCFGFQMGYVPFDAGRALRIPKQRATLAERILSEEAVQRMLALEPSDRNRALIRLLYASGGRISEITGLCWRNCQPRDTGGQITLFGKGGKTRAVRLSPATWSEILLLRAELAGAGEPVFRSQKGNRLSERQAQRVVQNAAQRAGIGANVSPHWLRHAHASHALERGAPIHLVQATLGHASVATTGRYLHARPTESSSKYLAI